MSTDRRRYESLETFVTRVPPKPRDEAGTDQHPIRKQESTRG